MSQSINNSKSMAVEKSKLTKLFSAIKKLLAKEFLWIVGILLLSLPLALIGNYLIAKFTPSLLPVIGSIPGNGSSLIGSYEISVAGLYFSRAIAGSIKTMIKKVQKETKP